MEKGKFMNSENYSIFIKKFANLTLQQIEETDKRITHFFTNRTSKKISPNGYELINEKSLIDLWNDIKELAGNTCQIIFVRQKNLMSTVYPFDLIPQTLELPRTDLQNLYARIQELLDRLP
jgi:hypothetical protein